MFFGVGLWWVVPTSKIHGTPFGSQSIVWTLVRHTVSRCLTFTALPTRSCGQNGPTLGLSQLKQVNTCGFPQFPLSGQCGLCFGHCFSGPLPLRSHYNPPCFRMSLVYRLHSEIDQIHLSIEAQCGTACSPTGDCHNLQQQTSMLHAFWTRLWMRTELPSNNSRHDLCTWTFYTCIGILLNEIHWGLCNHVILGKW